MTVLKSLRNRGRTGLRSCLVRRRIEGMRLAAGEALVRPQIDLGVVIDAAMLGFCFVIADTRGGGR